jgi:hypothetical protein
MADLTAIRAGIAANIKAVFPESTCTGYLLQSPNSPAFEVEFAGKTYDLAMGRGIDEWKFTIRGLASSAILDEQAQKKLDEWLDSTGATSLKAAVEADKTLGGSVSHSQIVSVGPVRQFSPISSPGTTYYGAEWVLMAVAPGD